MHAGLFKLLGLVLESIPGVLNQAAPTMKAAISRTENKGTFEARTEDHRGGWSGERKEASSAHSRFAVGATSLSS